MKPLYDLFPLLLFFIAYKFYGIYTATAVAIAASVTQVLYTWITLKRVESLQIITCILIIVFGGMTLYLHNPIFIKWKPSVINWVLGVIFLSSHFIGKQPLIKHVLDKQISMEDAMWKKLSWMWIGFFFLVGGLNIYVAYHYSTDVWVNFKVFGLLGIAILFGVYQATFITKHATEIKNQSQE